MLNTILIPFLMMIQRLRRKYRQFYKIIMLILLITAFFEIKRWIYEFYKYDIFSFLEVLKYFPNFFPSFLGILLAFYLNRWWEKKIYNNRVMQIVPYLYIEMMLNLGFILQWKNDPYEFLKNNLYFEMSHWNMFKDELSNWAATNIVPLTRLYYHLNKTNLLLSKYTDDKKDEIDYSLNIAEKVIMMQSDRYKKMFRKYPETRTSLDKVFEEYKQISYLDPEVRNIIIASFFKDRNTLT